MCQQLSMDIDTGDSDELDEETLVEESGLDIDNLIRSRRVLLATDRAGLVVVTAENAGGVSRWATVAHAARSEGTRRVLADAAVFGAFYP
jgi:hypothetical protein